MVLDEHPCTLGESTFVAASHDHAKGFQDTADLTIDLNAHINELTTNAQQRHPFMCREALDLNLPVPAIRTISARPRASLRSDLEGRTDRAAWAWRASMQSTGSPAAFKECHRHGDVGPL